MAANAPLIPLLDLPPIRDQPDASPCAASLTDLAKLMANIESNIILKLRDVNIDNSSGDHGSGQQVLDFITENQDRAQRIRQDLEDFRYRGDVLGTSYLKGSGAIEFWKPYYDALEKAAGSQSRAAHDLNMRAAIQEHMELVSQVPNAILKASNDGELTATSRGFLGSRWRALKEFATSIGHLDLVNWKIILDLDCDVQEVRNGPLRTRKNHIWLLWVICLMAVVNFGLTFGYTFRQWSARGSAKDAAFLGTLSQIVTQTTGLFTMAVPLFTKKKGWRLIPLVIAALSTIAAAPVYLFLPLIWASFALLAGAIVQNFFILQFVVWGRLY